MHKLGIFSAFLCIFFFVKVKCASIKDSLQWAIHFCGDQKRVLLNYEGLNWHTVESFIFVGLKFRGFQMSDKSVGI